jgi:hypothetical protein
MVVIFRKKKIAITIFVLLMLTLVISTYMPIAEVYGKHKSDNNIITIIYFQQITVKQIQKKHNG